MESYKNFNKALKFFMRELISMYPHMPELKLMFSFYKIMKTVSKKAPQKYFQELVAPHHTDLVNKNLECFMREDIVEDPTIRKMLGPLKQEYHKMNQENKDMIYNHIIVLYKLSLICEQKLGGELSIKTEPQSLQA